MQLKSVLIHGYDQGCPGRCTHCINRLDGLPHTVAVYDTGHGTECSIKSCMYCLVSRPLHEYEVVMGKDFTDKFVVEVERLYAAHGISDSAA